MIRGILVGGAIAVLLGCLMLLGYCIAFMLAPDEHEPSGTAWPEDEVDWTAEDMKRWKR